MIKTYGLTHVALRVKDVQRAAKFYQHVFGMIIVYDDATVIQLQTPGSRDVLVLEKKPSEAGKQGSVQHFGWRLVDPEDIDLAGKAVREAGGTVKELGEFVPGEPYLFADDLDGNEIEIWYEIPTKVDPPSTKPRRALKKPSR